MKFDPVPNMPEVTSQMLRDAESETLGVALWLDWGLSGGPVKAPQGIVFGWTPYLHPGQTQA